MQTSDQTGNTQKFSDQTPSKYEEEFIKQQQQMYLKQQQLFQQEQILQQTTITKPMSDSEKICKVVLELLETERQYVQVRLCFF